MVGGYEATYARVEVWKAEPESNGAVARVDHRVKVAAPVVTHAQRGVQQLRGRGADFYLPQSVLLEFIHLKQKRHINTHPSGNYP